MSDEPPWDPNYDDVDDGFANRHAGDGNVLVFRNSAGEPVAVPDGVVTQSERAYRVYKLRMSGKSWAEAALIEGYESAAQCQYDTTRYLEEAQALITEQSQRDMLTLEVMRLDALQAAWWEQAQGQNLNAARFVLDVVKTRAALTGLDAEKAGNTTGANTTVVVPVSSEEYVATMKRVAARQEPPAVAPPE